MFEQGIIKKYLIDVSGTTLVIHIPDKNYQEAIVSKRMKNCGLWLEDGRHITAEQRKKIYATLADIAAYTGYLPEELKGQMKYLHIVQTGCRHFSLSDCSIDTAREFINTIIGFALENGIPLSDLGVNRTDDINKYLYMCLKTKKCAVCGKKGEIHHWDAIGRGYDRRHFDDSAHRKVCLCRTHHTECHTIGREAFESRHKVYGIVTS